jgi:hypothetical protein
MPETALDKFDLQESDVGRVLVLDRHDVDDAHPSAGAENEL